MNNTLIFGRHNASSLDNARTGAKKKKHRIGRAFTLVELIVIVAVVGMLAALLMPALARAKAQSQRITCASRLKNIGLAFRVFSTEHSGAFPMTVNPSKGGSSDAVDLDKTLLVFRHLLVLSNELNTPIACICPSDKRTIATVFSTNAQPSQGWRNVTPFAGPRNVSYFVGVNADETKPQSLLSGDRNLMIYPDASVVNPHTNLSLSTATQFGTNTAKVEWSEKEMHKGQGNIVLGDGSVQQYTTGRLKTFINQSGEAKMTIMFPGGEE